MPGGQSQLRRGCGPRLAALQGAPLGGCVSNVTLLDTPPHTHTPLHGFPPLPLQACCLRKRGDAWSERGQTMVGPASVFFLLARNEQPEV